MELWIIPAIPGEMIRINIDRRLQTYGTGISWNCAGFYSDDLQPFIHDLIKRFLFKPINEMWEKASEMASQDPGMAEGQRKKPR